VSIALEAANVAGFTFCKPLVKVLKTRLNKPIITKTNAKLNPPRKGLSKIDNLQRMIRGIYIAHRATITVLTDLEYSLKHRRITDPEDRRFLPGGANAK